MEHEPRIAAVIAAAGQSRRMGRPKQLLPWGDATVIAAVVNNLHSAGAAPVVCVVGHRSAELREALRDAPAVLVYNEEYRAKEMIASYQAGVRWLRREQTPCTGTLIALSDQPQIPAAIIEQVLAEAARQPDRIVIPSHRMRRGHPMYLPAALWDELLALPPGETLRDLIRRHEARIAYVVVESDAILRDLDTPEEYAALRREDLQHEDLQRDA
ncbi:MAG: nucleotidyltransferase family protein [Caldilineaceae bacterium]|nr:nucleotidyltransferase family protein [Caldilineaceae bacterium]